MKTINFLTMAAFCAAVLCSCAGAEKHEDFVDNAPKPVEVKFGSKNIAAMQTKVDGNLWDGNEEIGVFMVHHATNYIISAHNVKYTNSASGSAASFASTTPIFYPTSTSEKVDFVAYHPYATLSSTWVYSIDVSDQSDQSAIDLMTAFADKGGTGYSQHDDEVDLNFEHRLVKLVFNITAGDGVDDANLTGLTVKIMNKNTLGTLSLEPGPSLVGIHIGTSNITALTSADGKTAEAIMLFNQAAAGTDIFFETTGGITFKATITSPVGSWAEGYKYTYDVNLSLNEAQLSGTGQPWLDGGNHTAEGFSE
ncbi:MAG: fimbrillin family protein [Tannerellaceae bacterium]|nr:fimbrillin family protein [Tannerellaceae bacterium]